MKSSSDNNETSSSFLEFYFKKQFLVKLVYCLLSKIEIENFSPVDNIYDVFSNFFQDLKKIIRSNDYLNISKEFYLNILEIFEKIIEVKRDKELININYENIFDYFEIDNTSRNFFAKIDTEKINNLEFLRENINEILINIKIFNQFKSIKNILHDWNDFVLQKENNINPLIWLKKFKEVVTDAYFHLNDDFGLVSEQNKIVYTSHVEKKSLQDVFKILNETYRVYHTGYPLIDKSINGLESANVTIVSGDSNHGKSIFALNLFANIIREYSKITSDKNEVFIIITLEDDIVKLNRRIMSIFGNYSTQSIRKLYEKYSFIKQNLNSENISTIDKIENIILEVSQDAIVKQTTNGKIEINIYHANESTFSISDVIKIVDNLQHAGKKIRAILIDYLDLMIPSVIQKNNFDDYFVQGEILKEMRFFARKYGVALLAITQNKRNSEFQKDSVLSNSMIGDSYKKIRYSDNVIMIRKFSQEDFSNSKIRLDTELTDALDQENIIKYCVPFEVKITKAKNGIANIGKFHIFNNLNLKIYNSFKDLIKDFKICSEKSKTLMDNINYLEYSDYEEYPDLF